MMLETSALGWLPSNDPDQAIPVLQMRSVDWDPRHEVLLAAMDFDLSWLFGTQPANSITSNSLDTFL